MNVLVIGGAGYIGSVVVATLLESGYRVRVFDSLLFGGSALLGCWHHPRFSCIKGDIRCKNDVDSALWGTNAIVNLAALVGEKACNADPKAAREINRDGAVELAAASKKRGITRCIFISTCSNYGVNSDKTLATEAAPLFPLTLYAKTKVEAEKAILSEASEKFFPCVLRFATVFGLSPRMRFDLIVNEFVLQAFNKIPLSIYKPRAWRPLVHVTDAAQAVMKVLSANPRVVSGEVFNIGYGNYQKQRIAQMVKEEFDTAVKLVPGGDGRDYRVSFAKARRLLHFRAKKSVKAGISEIGKALLTGIFNEKIYSSN